MLATRRCDILAYTLREGDATSHHTFALARVLADLGIRPTIYCNYAPGALPDDIRQITRHVSYASYNSDSSLTILQYPLWFPLAERFRTAPGARLFWYHGVTPPEYWTQEMDRDIFETSQVRTDLANFAHLAVAASPFTAAELHTHSSYPHDLMRIVPLGVDTKIFSVQPEQKVLHSLRKRWQLHDSPVLLYVGRIAGNKRIDLLIDALPLLAPKHPDLRLLIVGEDRDALATKTLVATLRLRAETLGVADRITFTGRVPDIAPYYHLADLFVLPSQHEGFGVPLVEAMAAGAPVVASASGAIPWLLGRELSNTESLKLESTGSDSDETESDEEIAGLLFEPGNAGAMADRIAKALIRRDLYAHLVDRGRQRAQDFTKQTFRIRAALTICEAIERHRAKESAPEASASRSELYQMADTILRSHVASSSVPLLGRHIAQVRSAATHHLREVYFDRVMERQVNFNRILASGISSLEEEMPDAESPEATDIR